MRLAIALVLSALIAGCATAPPAPPDARFFRDASFRPPSQRISAEDVFALSPEMKRYLRDEIEDRARVRGRQYALVDALYNRAQLQLEYDTELTRNAAEAFASRSGNCLSLVIMTAAFAKALDLPVTYQKLIVDDVWARSGDVYLAIGHVNLTLGRYKSDEIGVGHLIGKKPHESDAVTIDFVPHDVAQTMRTRPLGEQVIIAMYMNNRAVEALAQGRVDDAYWWSRAAVGQAPAFFVAYNTLGAIYQRHGDLQAAADVLRHVLDREPDNAQAMSNLIVVLRDMGRADEAQRLEARLQQLEPEPAFAHFQRGMAAMKVGDMKTAQDELAREVRRAPDYHEFHFWLAVAYLNLGQVDDARRHLELAMRNSTTRRDHDLYAAKLERLSGAH
ncbi:MAG: tetratricopeptide repeat protein [Burkholderiales bacterium]